MARELPLQFNGQFQKKVPIDNRRATVPPGSQARSQAKADASEASVRCEDINFLEIFKIVDSGAQLRS